MGRSDFKELRILCKFDMARLKIPITVRIHPDLLGRVRMCAKQDNRTLTNFIETALHERVRLKSTGTAAGNASKHDGRAF